MAFADWDFYTRVTEQTIPSDILVFSDDEETITDSHALHILDNGVPARATVAFSIKGLEYPTLLDSGRIRGLFQRKTGNGFRDYGFYFLTSGRNPLLDGVRGYVAYFIDGTSNLRVSKFVNGLHDPTGFATISNLTTENSGSTETVAFEVQWYGGVISDFSGYTRIDVSFKSDSADFENLTDFDPIQHNESPYQIGYCGVWVRSRSVTEPIDALIDNVSVFEQKFI